MSSDTPTINLTATGANIKALLKNKGFKVADVQTRFGFHPKGVTICYFVCKWLVLK